MGMDCNLKEQILIFNLCPWFTDSPGDSTDKVAIVVACVMFVVLSFLLTVGVIYVYKSKCYKAKYTPADPEEKVPHGPELDISGLRFDQMVGQGRYGSVWRCYLKGEVVAVKVFPPGHRDTWESEREVYEGQLSHPSILRVWLHQWTVLYLRVDHCW